MFSFYIMDIMALTWRILLHPAFLIFIHVPSSVHQSVIFDTSVAPL